MRTRTKGIHVASDGGKVVEKQYRGKRIFARLGTVGQDEAETWLRQEQNRIDLESSQGTQRTFAIAASRYLDDCEMRKVRSLESIAWHITMILPHIGSKPLEAVHSGTLAAFCKERIASGVSATTVNRTLEVVKSVLLAAARESGATTMARHGWVRLR